jgi:hypothetical protein
MSEAEGEVAAEESVQEPTPYVNPDGSFTDDWTSNLTGDYEAAAKTAERYKSVPELAKAVYHARQQLSSKDERAYVPNGSATDEEVAKYREALGIPSDAAEYKIERPEGIPDEAWDDNLAASYGQLFHEQNIPPAAANALVAKHAEIEAQRAMAMEQQINDRREAGLEELRKEYGPDFQKQLDYARRMAVTAGVDPNAEGFDSPAVVKALAYAGRNMREDSLVATGEVGGSSDASALAREIMNEPTHPEYEKFWSDHPATRKRVNDLLSRGKRGPG